MAYSSGTGFRFRRSLYGGDQPAAVNFRVANSATLKIGDAVRVDQDGYLIRAGAGNAVLGILVGLYGGDSVNDGLNLFALGAPSTGATLTEDDQVATASDNESRQTFVSGAVVIDPAGAILWYNDADGDLAQGDEFVLYDVVAASGQIDQSSEDNDGTGGGQFQLVQRDPDGDGDASKGLFRIAEPQVISQIGNNTTGATVNAA